jgi:glyceraldehyde-3-phosphate dehydrogenase/erythrose-4-phosphate dehydrogenase
MHAVSFRVPTPLVSAADMTLVLQSLATRDDVLAVLKRAADLYPSVIHLTQEPLVSIDIRGMPHSVVMEERWIQLQGDHILKLIAWYDNEWAYAERVLDTLALLDSTIGSP